MDLYRLSRTAQRAMKIAEQAALELGHGRLDTVHLLLGLQAETGAAATVLGKLGIERAKLVRVADEVYEGVRGGGRARDLDLSSGEAKEALELARDEADASGEHEIAPARLFLAATEDEEWSAYKALRALGVDVEKARKDVEALVRDEAQGSL
jgi:ATP-dependent Clp protease ATP-binding subunit ClpC